MEDLMSDENREQELDEQIREKEHKVHLLDMDIQRLDLELEKRNAAYDLEKHELLRRAIEAGSNAYGKMGGTEVATLVAKAAEKLTAEIEKL